METIKKIETGEYELVLPSNEDPSPSYLLTLSREGYRLVNEVCDVEWDDEETGETVYKDIYYFVNDKEIDEDEIANINLVKECNGSEVTVTLHFDKLSNPHTSIKEKTQLVEVIKDALAEIGEWPVFNSLGKVEVTTENPGKVHTILQKFGW